MTSLEVHPVAGARGATMTGTDLATMTESPQLDDLRRALADHLVRFPPEQHFDLDALEWVTDLLGGRDVTPFVTALADRPYVIHTHAIWEGRCALHNALNDYSGVRREMFRTSVKGSAPRRRDSAGGSGGAGTA